MKRSTKRTLGQVAPLVGLAAILGPHFSSIGQEVSSFGTQVSSAVAGPAPALAPAPPERFVEPATPGAPATPAEWFARIRPMCTPASVTLATDLSPAPETVEGVGYKAACFALGRKLPNARAVLLSLDESRRAEAASVVYEVARSTAEQGHHGAVGPLVELVIEFWPNHYLALYQAGATRYSLGDTSGARSYLERFLAVYAAEDSLADQARRMLDGTATLPGEGPA